MATDEELRPYGYASGNYLIWCVTCGRTKNGMHKRAFKCRSCASEQCRETDRAVSLAGDLPANPVPAPKASPQPSPPARDGYPVMGVDACAVVKFTNCV